MKIALKGGSIIALAVPSDGGDIQGAIASEAEKAGSTVASDTIQVREVYLSDVEYPDLRPVFTSGVAGQIQTEEQDFAYAYDADEVERIAEEFLEGNTILLCHLLHQLTYENILSGPVYDVRNPIENETIGKMDTLETRRAFGLKPAINAFVSDYIDGCNCQPEYDDVINDLDEKGLLPPYASGWWPGDFFITVAAAIAAEVIRNRDVSKEMAEAALKARDTNLFVVGRDPYRNDQIQVGREIEGGRDFVNQGHFANYRAIVTWAQDDENFPAYGSEQDDFEHEAA
ncbi:hypothetical protein ASF65_00065 [Aureimonas sp. Leaf324]|nr:hypothetical protein ASF65_00065 [Aureimonas sp. Leaf324]